MSAWTITPVSATSSRPVSRSRTISAPWPSADSSGRGPGDLVGDVLDRPSLRRRQEPVERPHAADPLEGPPELRLEDDDEREQADDGEGLEDLGEEPQVEGPGRGIDREQDADADHEADGARPADQAEQPVDEERRDPDVDQRGQVDLLDDRRDWLRHRSAVYIARSGSPAVRGRPRAARDGASAHRGGRVSRADYDRDIAPVRRTARPRRASSASRSATIAHRRSRSGHRRRDRRCARAGGASRRPATRQPRSRYSSARSRWRSGSARRDRDREVAGVDRGDEPAGPPMSSSRRPAGPRGLAELARMEMRLRGGTQGDARARPARRPRPRGLRLDRFGDRFGLRTGAPRHGPAIGRRRLGRDGRLEQARPVGGLLDRRRARTVLVDRRGVAIEVPDAPSGGTPARAGAGRRPRRREDLERLGERPLRGLVAGRQVPEADRECLDLSAPGPRFGQLQRSAGRVGRIGQPAGGIEAIGQPIQCRGGFRRGGRAGSTSPRCRATPSRHGARAPGPADRPRWHRRAGSSSRGSRRCWHAATRGRARSRPLRRRRRSRHRGGPEAPRRGRDGGRPCTARTATSPRPRRIVA